jgi:hypothetical protein
MSDGVATALDRETLAALADVLIPAADGMPSASEAGATRELLDEVLRVRSDLEEPLRQVAEAARGRDAAVEVGRLQAEAPELFEALSTAIAGGYFMSPDVRERLGYPGQQARPFVPRPDYEEDGLIQSVIERGPIYRPTP